MRVEGERRRERGGREEEVREGREIGGREERKSEGTVMKERKRRELEEVERNKHQQAGRD